MHSNDLLPPLIVILGPTAVGKTELSIQLAERINGEIISADSRLFYRGMDIGTAKPSKSDRDRVPHHLIDIAEPDDVWSLGRFKREVSKIITAIHKRGKIPLLVGGTGQYIRAITEGWVVPELEADIRLRNALKKWTDQIGVDGLHTRLKAIDASAAAKIAPNNVRRTIRALEVIFHTGKKFSTLRDREPVPYHVIQVGLMRPREELFQRIDERVDTMMASGFVGEVEKLLEMGFSQGLSSMSAIGYRQLVSYINGEISLDEAGVLIKRMTKQFVRKQANWFREDDPQIQWFKMAPGVIEKVGKYVLNLV
jgi:tRNA dimethylallyltransferase